MRRRRRGGMFVFGDEGDAMKLTGYCEPWSAQAGESVEFKVSSTVGDYNAEIVQLIHGDANPRGPGVKTKSVKDLGPIQASGEQILRTGSYISIDVGTVFKDLADFTLTLWAMPTLNKAGRQCLSSHWEKDEESGWALSLTSEQQLQFQYVDARGRTAAN